MADDRDPTAPAVTESDIPSSMSSDEAADLLSGNIEHLLGINVSEDGDDQDQGDEDRQSDDADDDDEDQRQEAESEDHGDDEDEDDIDDDQGDDDQSDDQSEDEASGAYDPDKELTFEVDGEQVTMKAGEWRDGFMRSRDYTRKTQALASTVASKVEEGIATARSELNERGQTLTGLVSLFDGMVPKQPSMQQLQQQYQDPATAARVYEQQVKLRQQIDKASQEAARLREDEDKRLSESQVETARRTIDIMRDTDSRWKSDDGFKREFAALQNYLGDQNLGEDDLVPILQKPGYVNIVMDAMYGQAVKNAKKNVGKKRQKSKVKTTQRTSSRQSVRANGKSRAELRKRVRQGDEQASLEMIESLV